MKSKPVVFLMGPTASGKTDAALQLCERFPFEIISVDSAMVYRGLDIGTAKPGRDVLARYPHRLIDICEPTESYSAGNFREDALLAIDEIHEQGKIPLLVGGTGLYFRALEQGIAELPPAHEETRKTLIEEAGQRGLQALHDELANVDPESARRIHPNDPQRIQRALEVFRVSGRTLSSFFDETSRPMPFESIKLVICPDKREVLHQRIEQRFQKMMEFGLLTEVKGLYQRGDLAADLPSMRVVGYRQAWQYLDGDIDEAEMRYRAVVATRQLAKRQLTWLRSEANTRWFDSAKQDFSREIGDFLETDPILS